MDISRYLAKVWAIYLMLIGMLMMTDLHGFMAGIMTMLATPGYIPVIGFFTLILGVFMVVAHNIWVWDWRLMVTVLSWLTLLKGFNMLAHPIVFDKLMHDTFANLYTQNLVLGYGMGLFNFLFGLILSYFAFRTK